MTDAADIEVDAQDAPIHRVKKAYEQVHDQLRDLIVRGELPRGQRLPNEAVLASQFGVSRGTVREALRVLAAQNLIRTAKGADAMVTKLLDTMKAADTPKKKKA